MNPHSEASPRGAVTLFSCSPMGEAPLTRCPEEVFCYEACWPKWLRASTPQQNGQACALGERHPGSVAFFPHGHASQTRLCKRLPTVGTCRKDRHAESFFALGPILFATYVIHLPWSPLQQSFVPPSVAARFGFGSGWLGRSEKKPRLELATRGELPVGGAT